MKIEDAREHAEHLCDVWTDEHIGVIEQLREHAAEPMAFVSGHPEYPGKWIFVAELGTSCKLHTHYHRSAPTDA
jgi:hypothetical protein